MSNIFKKIIMKFLFLSIIYFLSGIFCTFDYDLVDGFVDIILEENQTYDFYIPMTEFQKARIDISYFFDETLDYIPISYVYINEYLERNGSSTNNSVIYLNLTIDYPGLIISEIVNFFNENPKNYISVSITPNASVDLFISIDILGGFYQMKENETLYLRPFHSGIPYYLIMKVKYGYILNLYLYHTRYIEPIFDNLTLYEYKDNNLTEVLSILQQDIEYKYKYEANSIEMKLIYKIKHYNTKLIIVELFSKKYNIDRLDAKFEIDKYYLDLYENHSFNLFELESKSFFYFNLESKFNQIINCSLRMNYNSTNNPIELITISETKSALSEKPLVTHFEEINSSNKNIYYKIKDNMTNFLQLKFNTHSNIEQFNISYNIIEELETNFNLLNGVSNKFKELIPKTNYYLFINSTYLKTLNIFLTIDKIPNKKPFVDVTIYENLNKENNSYINKKSEYLKFDEDEKQLITYFSYMVFNHLTNNVSLEIIPEVVIKSMNVRMDVGGGAYNLKNGISSSYTNILSNFKYFFIIDAIMNKKAFITLKLNKNTSPYPFEYITIYEKQNINSETQSWNEEVKFNIKSGELISKIFYKIKSLSCDKIVIEIIPELNISFINICVEFVDLDYVDSDSETVYIIVFSILGIIIIAAIIVIIIFIKRKKNKLNSNDDSRSDEKQLQLNISNE